MFFNHYSLDVIDSLKRVTESNGKRCYRTPDGASYPSVTTFINDDPAKQASLKKWRKKVGNDQAAAITKEASNRGQKVHEIIEQFLKNETIDWNNVNESVQWLFEKMITQLKRIDNIRGQEMPLYSHKLQLAGTVDLVAEFDGELSIIDFKTSRKFKPIKFCHDYFLQTLLYACMMKELYNLTPTQLVIIIVDNESFNSYSYIDLPKNYKKLLNERLIQFRKRRQAQ
jgi:genome maintenance exonuclease 1